MERKKDGTIRYLNPKGQPHRMGGPAVIHPDGSEQWYYKDQRPSSVCGWSAIAFVRFLIVVDNKIMVYNK